ncbi:MAG TPA: response regulator transcription factor [Anaerolineae bacterium]|nr:response regulator transcription factor [Anaerolineae bacterium]HQJ51430.1 response regulator transcription factor [Anaerolineae bacterium]
MGDKTKLLIIEDDADLVKALELYFSRAGYEVVTAANGLEGLQVLYKERPDIVILDIAMPKLDGWEVCRRIRELSQVPIVILTARVQEDERVKGLKLGADDYVVKPFSLKELDARLEAVLRRARAARPMKEGVIFANNELVIDSDRLIVTREGRHVELTPTELRLLLFLAENEGRVLTHKQILEKIWGAEYVDDVDYVKLFVYRLRRKIEADAENPRYILSERGIGYRFVNPVT